MARKAGKSADCLKKCRLGIKKRNKRGKEKGETDDPAIHLVRSYFICSCFKVIEGAGRGNGLEREKTVSWEKNKEESTIKPCAGGFLSPPSSFGSREKVDVTDFSK